MRCHLIEPEAVEVIVFSALTGVGLGFECLGQALGFLSFDLAFWALGFILEKFRTSLAFRTRIFSSSGFRCGPQTDGVYNEFFYCH